jgi:hypothetical protein
MRMFESIVIFQAIFFALSVLIAVGVPLGRFVWRRPMVRLPPPKDNPTFAKVASSSSWFIGAVIGDLIGGPLGLIIGIVVGSFVGFYIWRNSNPRTS